MDKFYAIEPVSENICRFDLNTFMNKQRSIYYKFKFEGEGIDVIDKYFLQIQEEVNEVKFAESTRDMLLELIDVCMYLGSTFYVFKDTTMFEDIIAVKTNVHSLGFNDLKDKAIQVVDEIQSALFFCRRMFPERKWHKTYNPDNIDPMRYEIFSNVILESIVKLIGFLFNHYSYSVISYHLNDKQKFIGEQLVVPVKEAVK